MFGIKNLVPKEFQVFLKHIGPSAFKIISVKEASSALYGLSQSYLNSKEAKALQVKVKPLLPKGVEMGDVSDSSVPANAEKEYGHRILQIYFSQIQSTEGLFLDLRQKHFQWQEDHLIWQPSNLQVRLKESFRQGLHSVYLGFYSDNPKELDAGLLKMGLIKESASEQEKQELKQLLLDHVGSDSPTAVNFELQKFSDSFEKFFAYLKRNNVKLSADFLHLGIYLVSLYLNLDSINQPLNVQKSAQEILLKPTS